MKTLSQVVVTLVFAVFTLISCGQNEAAEKKPESQQEPKTSPEDSEMETEAVQPSSDNPESSTKAQSGSASNSSTTTATNASNNSSSSSSSTPTTNPDSSTSNSAGSGSDPQPEASETATAAERRSAALAVLSSECMSCHQHTDWSLWDSDADWQNSGLVEPTRPLDSLLVSKLKNAGGNMPDGGSPLATADFNKIKDWISGM